VEGAMRGGIWAGLWFWGRPTNSKEKVIPVSQRPQRTASFNNPNEPGSRFFPGSPNKSPVSWNFDFDLRDPQLRTKPTPPMLLTFRMWTDKWMFRFVFLKEALSEQILSFYTFLLCPKAVLDTYLSLKI
jgi:hypothetical protein